MEQWFIALDHRGLRQSALDEARKVKWVSEVGREPHSRARSSSGQTGASRASAPGACRCRSSSAAIAARRLLDRALILKFREKVVKDGVDIWFERSVARIVRRREMPALRRDELGEKPGHRGRVVRIGREPSRRVEDATGAGVSRGRVSGRQRPASRLVPVVAADGDGDREARAVQDAW